MAPPRVRPAPPREPPHGRTYLARAVESDRLAGAKLTTALGIEGKEALPPCLTRELTQAQTDLTVTMNRLR